VLKFVESKTTKTKTTLPPPKKKPNKDINGIAKSTQATNSCGRRFLVLIIITLLTNFK
jgi:hypothetical protein